MARLADIQAARLAGALLAGDVVKVDATFTLISRRKVRFWIGASATLAAIILISWKVESHDSQSSGLSLGEQSPIQEKDMKFTQALSVAVAAGSICSGVTAQSSAVQWTTASGGNGHWYRVVVATVTWDVAANSAMGLGGHLATIQSADESALIRSLGVWDNCWIGLTQNHSSSAFLEPTGGWEWVTGEPVTYTNWRIHTNPPEPNNYGGYEDWAHLDAGAVTWNDSEQLPPPWNGVTAYAVEYSADCNSDGIVDYGQILSGELIDTNSNGIPDICELDPCPGDINLNSVVDAVDLAMVLTSWGTSGSEYPRADVNHDGVVNGPDLGALLGGWGSCP